MREADIILPIQEPFLVRRHCATALVILLALAAPAAAQTADTTVHHDKTFLTRKDAGIAAIAFGATAILSHWDPQIARWSQDSSFQGSGLHNFASKVSKVNETSLTAAGILAYGIGRLSHSPVVTDVALHATESVVLASLVSQVIRGPLGRTRPYVTNDSDQYDFHFMKGFRSGEEGFRHRSFPSIHTSSAMAVATVLTMETNLRHPEATKFVAPLAYGLLVLPGLARLDLNQHWASDIFAGGVMGVLAGYKVVSYSHDHPNNVFDRTLLRASVSPNPKGGVDLGFSLF